MKKNILPILLMVIVAFAGAVGYMAFVSDSEDPDDMDMSDREDMEMDDNDAVMPPPPPAETTAPVSTGVVRTFEITASDFAFSQKEIRVKRGETVKVVLTVASGFHDWTLNEFTAKTSQLSAEGSETVTFVADRSGSFEYYCSVGGHRQMGMVGTLIVE